MTTPRRIIITPGEPAGIGPDLTIMMAQQSWPVELVVVADPDLLMQRAEQLQLPLDLTTDSLRLIPVSLSAPVKAGVADPRNADYVMRTLAIAADHCKKQEAAAVVTGPVNKEIINQAGIAFTGHTEFFAQSCGVPQTIMLFVVDDLKVALVTTHLPLAKVSAAITRDRLMHTVGILHAGLKQFFQLANPRILVCGLNPHAGEGGYLGREEIEVIAPALEELRQQGYALQGPLAADTIFTPAFLKQGDAVLSMYHDQALPLVKYIGFGHAVNVTLGLPFVRTSVDHGTALDVAGTGRADPGSMLAALQLAIKMTSRELPSLNA